MKHILSGFKSLDVIAGGYRAGKPTVLRADETMGGDAVLQTFILRQARKFAMEQGKKTLYMTMSMTEEEFAQVIVIDLEHSPEKLKELKDAPLFLSVHDTVAYDDEPEFICEFIRGKITENGYEAVVIDGAEVVFDAIHDGEKSIASIQFLESLEDIIKDTDTVLLLADYDNVIENCDPARGYKYPEIIFNTDVYDRLQAACYAGTERHLIDDIYGFSEESAGVQAIKAERIRQKVQEGYTSEHDKKWEKGELADAAATYALTPMSMEKYVTRMPGDKSGVPTLWPFGKEYYKPTPDDRIRQLAKAGAFIAAEIDRLTQLK